jgi:hypothetical protein
LEKQVALSVYHAGRQRLITAGQRMQRIGSRTYVGQPREVVTVTTQVSLGGQAAVIVNGVDMGPQARFPLPPDPGDRIKWQVALMGPLGATCVVGITVVDGGSDGDFLICQAHNPAPVHFYTGSVIEAPAMRALKGMRRTKGARKARKRSKTPTQTIKKVAAMKPATKKRSTKRTAASRSAKKKTAKKKTAKKKSAQKASSKKVGLR